MVPSAGMQRTKNCRVGIRRMSIGMFVRWLIAASAMFVFSPGDTFACFSSADQVRQENPGAWPSWTFREPGHEGAKCWFPSTRATAHDLRAPLIPRTEHTGSKEHFERGSEVTGFARQTNIVAPRSPTPSSSFDDRFSAEGAGNS